MKTNPAPTGAPPTRRLEYTAVIKGERRSYDPATEGLFAYGYNETAMDVIVELAFGSLSKPSPDRETVERDLALVLAEHPEAQEKLSLYVVPGIFSSREGWVLQPEGVPHETLELAKQVGEDRSDRELWLNGDAEYISGLRAEFVVADASAPTGPRPLPVPQFVPVEPIDFRAA